LLPEKSGCIISQGNVEHCGTVDGFVGNIGICWIWGTYVANTFKLAFWESAGSFIPLETKLTGCLTAVLWLVWKKLTFCRAVGETEAVATYIWRLLLGQ